MYVLGVFDVARVIVHRRDVSARTDQPGVALQNVEIETGRRVERIKQLLSAEIRRVSRREILQEFEAKISGRHGRVRSGGRRLGVLLLLRQTAHTRATRPVLLMRMQR